VSAVLRCPGQGAQRVGMGKDLAERFPAGNGLAGLTKRIAPGMRVGSIGTAVDAEGSLETGLA